MAGTTSTAMAYSSGDDYAAVSTAVNHATGGAAATANSLKTTAPMMVAAQTTGSDATMAPFAKATASNAAMGHVGAAVGTFIQDANADSAAAGSGTTLSAVASTYTGRF